MTSLYDPRPERWPQEREIDKLLRAVVKLECSELQLKVASAPFVHVKGQLRPLNRGPLSDEEMARICLPLLDENSRQTFEHTGSVDFTYTCECDGVAWHFRVTIQRQRLHICLTAKRLDPS